CLVLRLSAPANQEQCLLPKHGSVPYCGSKSAALPGNEFHQWLQASEPAASLTALSSRGWLYSPSLLLLLQKYSIDCMKDISQAILPIQNRSSGRNKRI